LKPFCPPVGPHAREQHDCWHWTFPAGHTVPATLQVPTPVPPGAPQRPFGFVPVFTQLPLQHWSLVKHASFCWTQKETALEQTPFWQRFEQHWLAAVQPLPCVRQPPPPATIGAHLPFVQMPLQHSVARVQAPATGVSGVHAFAAHCPFDPQKPEQQSVPNRQAPPMSLHAPPPPVPQTLGLVAPQIAPPGQAAEPTPHGQRPPQPSGMNPQFMPAHAVACAVFVHWVAPPHWLGALTPHDSGDWHCPQSMTFPQPSAIGPHEFAGQVVSGTQPVIVPPPHTFDCPPPPQTAGAVQAPPQLTVPPQPSATLPQFIPTGHCVTVGVHVGAPH
jgi:hypothetical protein